MWLTRVFLQRWPLAVVFVVLTLLAGIISVRGLIVQRLPNTQTPTVGMRVTYSGASTTELRDTIVRPIEDQISGSQDLTHVDTTIETGSAVVAAHFKLGSNKNQDLTEIIQAYNAARSQLPSDLVTPVIRLFDPNAATVVSVGLTSSTLDQASIASLANGQIGPAIEQLGGISNVLVAGNVQASYNVNVDPSALAGYGLTLSDVVNTLGTNNLRAPGGIAYQPGRETQIDVRGDIDSPRALAAIPITSTQAASTGGGNAPTLYGPNPYTGSLYGWTRPSQSVFIGDIGRVEDGSVPIRNTTFVNGKPGIELQVQKAGNASEIDVSNEVIAALPKLQAQFPQVQMRIDFVQATYSKQQVDGVERTLLEGILLTAILMLLFLQSWRNAVVVMIAIPTSLCVALLGMKILGLSLDTISLLAMTLVIGILIDDSTVVLENVTRHHDDGEEPMLAALNGRSEIGQAAIVITLVDVVVFLPIAFIGGPIGVELAEFGIVVTISTLTSLFVSFTLTPTMAGTWSMKSSWKPWKPIVAFDRFFERVRKLYSDRALPAAIRRPWPIIVTAVALTFGAMLLIPFGLVGRDYIPDADQGQIFYTLTFAPGTPLTTTTAALRRIEARVDTFSDLESEVTSAGGFNSPYGGFVLEGNGGQINLNLKADHKQPSQHWIEELQRLSRELAPNAVALAKEASDPTQGGPRQPVDEVVSLPSGDDPTQAALRVQRVLEGTPGAINVNSSAQTALPQVAVQFDRAMARTLGVSIGDASTAIRAAFGGDTATELESQNGLVQVQVIYPQSAQHSLADVLSIPIRASNGSIAHVGDIAHLSVSPAPIIITRTNRLDIVHINASLAPGFELSNVMDDFHARLAKLHLPSDVKVVDYPDSQLDLMQLTLQGLGTSLILSVVLVYLLMVALYNDFRDPLIIMFSVPLATVGALVGLWITHQTLNLFSLIGALLLVGLVAKNGILLVDYTNTLRKRDGLGKRDAAIEAGATRFRPIIMTTLAMITGMLPLALALEPGSQVRSSLGVVVIGGLLSSLVLTLFIVPIVYQWLAPDDLPEPTPIGDEDERSKNDARPQGEGAPASA